jgi:hypothetical protein
MIKKCIIIIINNYNILILINNKIIEKKNIKLKISINKNNKIINKKNKLIFNSS